MLFSVNTKLKCDLNVLWQIYAHGHEGKKSFTFSVQIIKKNKNKWVFEAIAKTGFQSGLNSQVHSLIHTYV